MMKHKVSEERCLFISIRGMSSTIFGFSSLVVNDCRKKENLSIPCLNASVRGDSFHPPSCLLCCLFSVYDFWGIPHERFSVRQRMRHNLSCVVFLLDLSHLACLLSLHSAWIMKHLKQQREVTKEGIKLSNHFGERIIFDDALLLLLGRERVSLSSSSSFHLVLTLFSRLASKCLLHKLSKWLFLYLSIYLSLSSVFWWWCKDTYVTQVLDTSHVKTREWHDHPCHGRHRTSSRNSGITLCFP